MPSTARYCVAPATKMIAGPEPLRSKPMTVPSLDVTVGIADLLVLLS